jgi:hypothetical protein
MVFSPRISLGILLALLALLALLTGCATSGMVTGRDDRTRQGGQAETDATTTFFRGVHRVVVGYNDDTSQAAIQYGANSRKVLRGASLMGWSYSEDRGDTWRYGGRLSPPSGWAALWGDPAVTTSKTSYGLVFLSSLAVPDAKFPASGIEGGFDSAVLGGACIARSTDGGVRFEHFQCIANKDPVQGLSNATLGHFYDGGSLAAGPRGEIYTSYIDIDTKQIDVWRSPDGQKPFVRLPQAFPNYYVGSHPRLRVSTDGTLYLMAVVKMAAGNDSPYGLVGSRFRDGAWESPKLILSKVAHYPSIDFGSSVQGARLILRTGPQFSFDIGVRSERFDDSVRFLVTHANDRGLFLRGGICNEQLTGCFWHNGWTFGNPVTQGRGGRMDVFNPNVTAFQGIIFGALPRWHASFLVREGDSTKTVSLTRATLGYIDDPDLGTSKAFSIPIDIARDVPVCTDVRPRLEGGYWGDYDGFLPVDVQEDRVRFLRFMTTSALGCTKRWTYSAEHQHVQAVSYWD